MPLLEIPSVDEDTEAERSAHRAAVLWQVTAAVAVVVPFSCRMVYGCSSWNFPPSSTL